MKTILYLADSYRSESRRNYLASSRIRGHWLSKYWDEVDDNFYPSDYGYDPKDSAEFFKLKTQLTNLEKYDTIIMNKTYEPDLVKELRKRGKIVILDMCDPDWKEPHSDINRINKCRDTMAEVDAIVVNGALMQYTVSKMFPDKRVYVIPDRLDLEWHKPKKNHHNKELKSICWYGYSANLRVLEPYMKDIIEMGLNITVYSDKSFESLVIPTKRDVSQQYAYRFWDIHTINRDIVKHDAVFVGEDKVKSLSQWKSNNRVLTGYALKMPVAYDIKDLIRLKSKRKRINDAETGYGWVRDGFNIRLSVRDYKKIIKELIC